METIKGQAVSRTGLDVSPLLPLRMLVVTLQFNQRTSVRFFHQVPLCAFLRYLAGGAGAFSRYIRIDSVETGRTHYLASDYYRFTVVCLAGGEPLLQRLIEQLQQLPVGVQLVNKAIPFRNNLILASLQDAFTSEPVTDVRDLCVYGPDQLQEERELWESHKLVSLRWITPARILKEKSVRGEGEQRYCRDTADLDAPLLLCRLRDSIGELLRHYDTPQPRRDSTPDINAFWSHLFWLDQEYIDINGKEKSMGGSFGEHMLEVTSLDSSWWDLLVLAQYTGVGQRTSFGWGRLQLVAEDESVSCRRVYPAVSHLSGVCDLDNLLDAYAHILANRPTATVELDENNSPQLQQWEYEDEESLPHVDDAVVDTLQRLAAKLQNDEYEIPSLRGVVMEKPDGDLRPLAIAPFWDAVIQRATAQYLSPALDALMYPKSHGYRRGKSRMTARYDIQRAWREGYHWVYESDIEDFFDSVDRRRLAIRLHALYGNDPVVPLLLNWMAAPVSYHNQLVQRQRGLPQGSPLSPLLANLMLDDFDNDMRAAGFCLVRFADDFVVMCKSEEHAKAAAKQAEQSLADQGLSLNREKTRTGHASDGFNYLGYKFVNDMAIDLSATDRQATRSASPTKNRTPQQPGNASAVGNAAIDTASVPPGSWLASVIKRVPQKITRSETLAKRAAELLATSRPFALAQNAAEPTLLVVAGEPSSLSTSLGKLCVSRKEKRLQEVPWETISAVLLFGNHQLTTQAMHQALRRQVPVHLANGYGKYHGTLFSGKPDQQGQLLWLQQLVMAQDQTACLEIARPLVASRLRHMHELLRKRKLQPEKIAQRNIRHLNRYKTLAELNGAEGAASQTYLNQIASLVPPQYGFSLRNRRPPKDPFNSLLSLGYTLLFGVCESIVRANGLLPTVGFYHQPHGRHATVASDLMEPFRHIVEQEALTLICNSTVSLANFSSETNGACKIDAQLRRRYISQLIARLQKPVRAAGETSPMTLFAHLDMQAKSLRSHLQQGTPFNAFRWR